MVVEIWCVAIGVIAVVWPGASRITGLRGGHLGGRACARGADDRLLGADPRRVGRGAAFWSRAAFRRRVRVTVVCAAAAAMVALAAVLPAGAGVSVRPAWVVAAVLVAATLWRLVRRARASARLRADLQQATVALRALVRELQGGIEPRLALARVAADASPAIAAVLEGLAGVSPDGSARRATRPGGAAWPAPSSAPGDFDRRLRAAWELAQRHGIPLAGVLAALAADFAGRCQVALARSAQVAGPAVSGYVLAALPVAGLLLGSGMGSDPLAVLGGTAVGNALLIVGVALGCAGLVWADRIARGAADV